MNTNPDPNDDQKELIFRAALLVGLIILILVIAFAVAAFSFSIEDTYRMDYKKYKKLPVVVEAAPITEQIVIKTREGQLVGKVGDMLIRGIENEPYPCDINIFNQTYEPVADSTPLGLQLTK